MGAFLDSSCSHKFVLPVLLYPIGAAQESSTDDKPASHAVTIDGYQNASYTGPEAAAPPPGKAANGAPAPAPTKTEQNSKDDKKPQQMVSTMALVSGVI